MDHFIVAKKQAIHLLIAFLYCSLLGVFAVCLDLASSYVARLGVTPFTSGALQWLSHGLLVIDLVLFCIYIIRTSIDLVREMFK